MSALEDTEKVGILRAFNIPALIRGPVLVCKHLAAGGKCTDFLRD